MKAEELMIGNILSYNDGKNSFPESIVQAADIQFCQDNPEGFNSVYKPVPLTEEWLFRFDFEEDFKNCYSNGKLTIFRDEKGLLCGAEKNDFYSGTGMGYSVVFKYVHVFQNFYFALTEEKLKIKEK